MSAQQGGAGTAALRIVVLVVVVLLSAGLGVLTAPAGRAASGSPSARSHGDTPAAVAGPAARDTARPAATATTPVSLALVSVTPAVASPGRPVTVEVTVTNTGRVPLAATRVSARLAGHALRTREEVRRAARTPPSRSVEVASASVPDLAPGARAPVPLVLPGEAIRATRSYGVYPLVLMAGAGAGTQQATLTTYVPFQSVKEYEPLSVAFLAPITPGPDPELVTATGAGRVEAWSKEIGPAGRLTSLVEATSGLPVTWAVDPAVLTATPAAGTRAADTAPPDARVDTLKGAFREGVADAGNPVWGLPPGDPDLAALTRAGASWELLKSLLSVPQPPGDRSGPVSKRVAWPVGEAPGRHERDTLAAAYGAGGPDAYVVADNTIDADPGVSGPAARRTPEGRPLLTFDDQLSRLFTAADAPDGAATTQRFLAETVGLLEEAPGRPQRTVLVAAGRGFDPDRASMHRLFAGMSQAPWLRVVSADSLLTGASSPTAPQASPHPGPEHTPDEPSPLDVDTVRTIGAAAADTRGVSSVLSPVSSSQLVPERATVQALSSTRWRGEQAAFTAALDAVTARLHALTTGVSVLASTVNFFAEHGALQVTVVNNLDVAVHDVRLVLEPQGRPPRLRVVDPPDPLTIRPRSRTTVRVGVEAVAAGVVPVTTYLTTPTGTTLGAAAEVRVRVRPTDGWLMLGLFGLVGLVFVAGLYRALRLGSPRVSSEDLKEINLA